MVSGSAGAQTAQGGVAAEHQVVPPSAALPAQGREAPEPDASTPGVAAEQRPIRVGDTIMAPALPGPGEEIEGAEHPKRRWYGAPILIVDGASYVTFLVATSSDVLAPVAVVGAGGFLLGGPITHVAHGNWGWAGLSVLARGTLPLVGAAAGAGDCEPEDGDACLGSVFSLAAVGMVAATVFDTAVLAFEPEPVATPALSAQPILGVSATHAFIGATGTF